MVRKSLLVAVLLTIATPLAGQEAPVEWTLGRPDGQAPIGVLDGQMLRKHQVLVGYRFVQTNSKGLWAANDSLTLDQSLQQFPYAPRTMVNETHELTLAFAPSSTLTLSAHMTYSQRTRDVWYSQNSTLYYQRTHVNELGDLAVSALYSVFRQGAYRAHVQLGALIPTGAYDPTAQTVFSGTGQGPLPYAMRAGAGTFAVVPGMTMLAQNKYGSVGAQVRGTFYVGNNNSGFAPGNVYEVTGWAAYRLNQYFSISGRIQYQRWNAVKGADPSVISYMAQDPGYDGDYAKGHSLQVPVGLNIYLPQGLHLGGNRLFIEYLPTASQSYEGYHLGADWGLVLGWNTIF